MSNKFLSLMIAGNDLPMRLMAINAGRKARADAAVIGHAAVVGLESNGTDEVAVLRAFDAICRMPLKIAKAVAATAVEQAEVKVSVLELNLQEYPGSLPRMLGGAGELTRTLLSGAGAHVFDHLQVNGLEPKLEYVYHGETRTYSLDIVITLAI